VEGVGLTIVNSKWKPWMPPYASPPCSGRLERFTRWCRHLSWMFNCGSVEVSCNPYRVWGFRRLWDAGGTDWIVNAGGIHIRVRG